MSTASANRIARFRILVTGVLGIVILVMVGQASVAGQTILTLEACKNAEPRAHVTGSELIVRQCGTRFTTGDPYVALVIHFREIRDQVDLRIELLDPEQSRVWTRSGSFRPEPG